MLVLRSLLTTFTYHLSPVTCHLSPSPITSKKKRPNAVRRAGALADCFTWPQVAVNRHEIVCLLLMLASPIQPGNCWTIQPVAGYHPHAAPTWSKERVRRVGESARIVSREGRGVSDGDQSPSIESSAVQLSALSVTIREPLVTDVGQLGVQRNPVVRNRKSYGVPKSREVVGAGECVAAPAR